MEDATILELASKYRKTPAQILLRQLLQRGIAVIPKSTNPQRLRQNLDVFEFEISDADMKALEKLDKNYRICDLTFLKG